jgi:hypothetical protein
MPHVLCMLAKLPGISFIDSENANAYLANDAPTQGLGLNTAIKISAAGRLSLSSSQAESQMIGIPEESGTWNEM